eukprot:3203720-Amphidinium_carterae.1
MLSTGRFSWVAKRIYPYFLLTSSSSRCECPRAAALFVRGTVVASGAFTSIAGSLLGGLATP